MSPKPDNEHRRHVRILFDAPATLTRDEQRWQTQVIDVSLKGALVRRPPDWNGAPGETYQLALQLDDDRLVIRMEVSVAHVHSDSIGFHCDHIDLDSITHLRRLVELNLGDAELLNRELSSLE